MMGCWHVVIRILFGNITHWLRTESLIIETPNQASHESAFDDMAGPRWLFGVARSRPSRCQPFFA